MKKSKLLLILLSVVMTFGLTVSTVAAAKVTVTVQVDGKNVNFPDEKPYFENDRVLIPIRFVSEALGAKVDYTKETVGSRVNRVVDVKISNRTIRMPVNSDNVLVNDVIVTLDVPARLQGSRVFVPLRFVSEALGAKVNWDQSKRLVSITTGKEITNPDPVPGGNNRYNDQFELDEDYTKMAKTLFLNNMKVAGGKLTITVPKEAKAAHLTNKGSITHLTSGKTYTFPIGEGEGFISITQVYPGKESQEGYSIILDSKLNEDLAALFGSVTNDVIISGGKEVNYRYGAATLTEVQNIVKQLN
ncbi:stalk domain-containing protein [Paenibacillus woosongensis]|uniref:Copper amine oxidase-like N-terminal domain-containing protein n=1 Tax=Paenibacillus woosongensis TaxID=307580 RepID=A0ABQ4MYV7_9BACL|nr:stalk domain-containing protein [Paenibacillus woosongensis]GIP61119.1 hypothetical protein J15TS10_49330 [Paenibacillus woosongensis]